MAPNPVQPWRDCAPNPENSELVALTRQAWSSAGVEHERRAGAGKKVQLLFLKEVQGYSPTTFNNSTCLKKTEPQNIPTFVARTPLRPNEV